MRFFEAAPGRARAIKKIFFAGFPFFTSKWNYCRVTGPQNKIFIKNQLTLIHMPIDTLQYRLLFGFFLLHTDRVPFELLDSAALLWWESCGGGGQILFLNLITII
jgi:hypothetical protein